MTHFMDHEPDPTPNTERPVWELVIEDMKERDHVGRQRYGTPLQCYNGRRPLVDAYQEALDLVVYLRQEIEERAQLDAELTRLRAVLDAPVTMLFADGREPTTNERHLRNLLSWREKEKADLKVELADARSVVQSLADRVAAQSELLSQRAEKVPRGPCGMLHHAQDCECEGAGGDR